MTRTRGFRPILWLLLLGALGTAQALFDHAAAARTQGAKQAPRYEVDPLWPKPLPNHWVLGNAIGVWADEALELKAGDCCAGAPPVLAFDTQGNLVQSWGGPGAGYDWPTGNHGIFVGHTGLVWIGGNGAGDSHILKFTQDGKFVAQYGKPNARQTGTGAQGQPAFAPGSSDPTSFGRVAKIFVDPKANEAYVADGYLNKRVAVIDADTGAFKRYWGAYGNKPDDTDLGKYDPEAPLAQQFRSPVHCAELANDGLVYVCDRANDRIQVFSKDGKFVKEKVIAKRTLGDGSVWDIAFSRDPAQKYIYLADGKNEKIYVIERATLEILSTFGDGGRQPGQFFGVHSIATDSKGNLYTTETYEGKRLQKFVYRGIGPVPKPDQGTPWPDAASR